LCADLNETSCSADLPPKIIPTLVFFPISIMRQKIIKQKTT
jgi:hypothetical protein